MNNFFKQSLLISSLVVGLLGMTGQAFAHLPPGGVEIDFEEGVFTPTNAVGPLPGAVFSAFGQSYIEEGVVHGAIGFGTTPGNSIGAISGGGSHVHGESAGGSTVSAILRDAGGAFYQLADSDSFSVAGLDVANMDLSLVGGGFSTMTLRGYTSADFSTFHDVILGDNGSGAPVSVNGDFDTETGAAFNGTHLHLDEVAEFGSLYLFEYFFDSLGRGNDGTQVANLIDLVFRVDNVELGPEVSAVPVPAAVYLFGTALLGLTGMRKKQAVA